MSAPLLVLGASEDQLPIYVEARRRGLPTIAVDYRADRPALAIADRFLQVSTRDDEAIAAALGPIEIAGVVSAASDACLPSWAALARRYGAPYGIPDAAAQASADKTAFRRLVERVGVPRYGWAASNDPAELVARSSVLRFPVVVKPADGSGSKGVTIIESPDDLAAAVRYAHELSFSGDMVVEEFVAGRELTIELFMRGGEPHFAPITQKRLARCLVAGHVCPAPLDEATRARVVDIARRLCLAMDITDGPANFDVVLTPDGTPYVLEVGARLCGNGYPRLLRAVYGVETVSALVSLAIGEPFDIAPQPPQHAILHILASPWDVPGELAHLSTVEKVRELPGVREFELFVQAGDPVQPFTQSGHKIGYLLVTGDTPAQAEQRLADAVEALGTTVIPRRSNQTNEGLPYDGH